MAKEGQAAEPVEKPSAAFLLPTSPMPARVAMFASRLLPRLVETYGALEALFFRKQKVGAMEK